MSVIEKQANTLNEASFIKETSNKSSNNNIEVVFKDNNIVINNKRIKYSFIDKITEKCDDFLIKYYKIKNKIFKMIK